MGGHKTKPAPPVCTPFTDTRFDYLDKLPCGVPPFQTLPSSSSSGPQPQFPSENGPAEITYYFPMPFTVGNPTGVFFPKDFPNPAPSEIDVILYLHGFKLGEFVTIDQYWAGGVHGIKFREDINAAGKQFVLIVPTLGARPGSTNVDDMGIFGKPGGAEDFLAETLKWIDKYVWMFSKTGVKSKIRKLILAGHSGAGVMLDIQCRTMKSTLHEVWGFDSTYSQWKAFKRNVVQDWKDIAKQRAPTKFFFHWGTEGPGTYSDALKGTSGNIKVEEGIHDHFGVLTSNFKKRVKAA